MIKSIVFDLGNVLIDFDPMRFVREKRRILKSKNAGVRNLWFSGLAAL